ncbi:MAG: DUF1294 domain-containing protein [Ruminococcus sp.]|nr:DUF1294 domain-containing protein [Ruminococcus sp.]
MKFFTITFIGLYSYYILAYLIVINIIAVVITIADKYRAKNHKWRISESTLLTVSALGGSAAMYITMLIIRHKTRKLKFMLGIPLIFVIELIIFLWMMNYV